ncbi:diadenylate cyclase CdaA [Candidatus Electronema sp. PJ]|uniref:diadenylate cyclase CdaA n=1 Tax=Candidatus Electronema sp. PJ TaxID=3401572 RepID=UPI003AA86C3A
MSSLLSFFSFPSSFRWQDAADILIVSFIVFRIIILIRGTRAVQMLAGALVIALLYFLSTALDLLALQLLLRSVLSSILLIMVIIFQEDIRRALTEMGRTPFFRSHKIAADDLTEIISAAVSLSRRRIGALIIIERETGLQEYVETGFVIDSRLLQELLLSIFLTKSPLHDGAVVIKNGRIHSAACVLPLSRNLSIDKRYGMRHRAALGLSEMTDAVIISVSEETQEISVVQNGSITPMRDEDKLETVLKDIFLVPEKKPSLWKLWKVRKLPQ